jgi:hypothetical protein
MSRAAAPATTSAAQVVARLEVARRLGVPVVNEAQLLALIGEA